MVPGSQPSTLSQSSARPRPLRRGVRRLWGLGPLSGGGPPEGTVGWIWGNEVVWEGVKEARPKGPIEIGMRNNTDLKRKRQAGTFRGIKKGSLSQFQ